MKRNTVQSLVSVIVYVIVTSRHPVFINPVAEGDPYHFVLKMVWGNRRDWFPGVGVLKQAAGGFNIVRQVHVHKFTRKKEIWIV